MHNLFTYGTLMHPVLIHRIIGRVPEHVRGRLSGFQRFQVKGEDYPAIVPGRGHIDGVVYLHLDSEEIDRLDAYESEVYLRRDVACQLQPVFNACEVYVLNPDLKHLLAPTDWDYAQFAARLERP